MTNVEGDWNIIQSNGFTVQVHLRQDGELIFGSAGTGSTSAEVAEDSRVVGDNFLLVLNWISGSVGEYHGIVGVNRRLTGVTFDRTNPGSQASWFSDRFF
jgi:hypothetical protein